MTWKNRQKLFGRASYLLQMFASRGGVWAESLFSNEEIAEAYEVAEKLDRYVKKSAD